jgi:nucleolar protein 12
MRFSPSNKTRSSSRSGNYEFNDARLPPRPRHHPRKSLRSGYRRHPPYLRRPEPRLGERSRTHASPIQRPPASPLLGQYRKAIQTSVKHLEHLSKEERKKEKAANADRVARRLAKKQVKAAMTKESLKFGVDGRSKERVRARTKGGASGPRGDRRRGRSRQRNRGSEVRRISRSEI